MKICYFNWVDYLDKRGGGVTVYQRNLMNFFDNDKVNVVYSISSGVYYSLKTDKCHYKRDGNNFKIINSETLAPAHISFGSDYQIKSDKTVKVFMDILNLIDVDIIHFNNLEGIPVLLLKEIKMNKPHIKIIVSMHNYYSICPQVNLWHDEKINCKNFLDGKNCVGCVHVHHSVSSVKKAYFLYSFLNNLKIKEGTKLFNLVFDLGVILNKTIKKFRKSNNKELMFNTEPLANSFYNRRKIFSDILNTYVDVILCVSDRVKEIFSNNIISTKLVTSYIGTEHYKYYSISNFTVFDDVLTVCYLGYMRVDKGFEFLLDALNNIDVDIAKNIKLVIAAPKNDHYFNKLLKVSRKFYSLNFYNGYNHENLTEILKNVNLGIVPPLWEDNLPQVAIEMHTRKIPLLTSDTGGASELHKKNKFFTFKSGNIKDFNLKLEQIFDKKVDYEYYFENSIKPISMSEHINELLKIYTSI